MTRDTAQLRRDYVDKSGRTMLLTNGNFAWMDKPATRLFARDLATDGASIAADDLAHLLSGDWRSRMVGAWLAAAVRRTEVRPAIVDLLAREEDLGPDQAYCVALARFAGDEDACALASYLGMSLQVPGGVAQAWALGGLLRLDEVNSTDKASRLIVPGGPWDHWVAMSFLDPDITNPRSERRRIDTICQALDNAG